MTNDQDLVLQASAEVIGRKSTFRPYRACTGMRVDSQGKLVLFPPRFAKAATKGYTAAIQAGLQVQS